MPVPTLTGRIIILALVLSGCGQMDASGKKRGSTTICSGETPNENPPSFHIVNGEATSDYPSVVMLTMDLGESIGVCTATYVGHNVLITAGHCVQHLELDAIKIHVGPQFVPRDAAQSANAIRPIQKFSALPDDQTEANKELVPVDFAMLMTPPNSAPAIMAISQSPPPASGWLDIVGYGKTSDSGAGSGTKRWAQTGIVDNGHSNNSIVAGAIFTGEIQVAGIQRLGRVAAGDSGGPLLHQQRLVGVTSIGITLTNQSGNESRVSGFNSVNSTAAQTIISQAQAAGAGIGIPSGQSNLAGNPNPNPCI